MGEDARTHRKLWPSVKRLMSVRMTGPQRRNGVGVGIRGLLASPFAWRASGFTYPSAVVATHGRLVTPSDYFQRCAEQMAPILRLVEQGGGTVLEFGSGLGGNLAAIAPRFDRGIGVDVNHGYVRLARRLARDHGVQNVEFRSYDGAALDLPVSTFRCVFSVGVFERLSRAQVLSYVEQLGTSLTDDGRMFLYFLSDRAANLPFTRLLGESSYTFWNQAQLRSDLSERGFRVVSVDGWKGLDGQNSVPAADLFTLVKGQSGTNGQLAHPGTAP
jgi:SAM-dependent methyltransferase